MNDKYDWIITIANSAASGSKIFRFFGTIEEAKQKILNLLLDDKDMTDENMWLSGSEDICDILYMDKEINAYANYQDYNDNFYSIQYTAKKFADVEFLR